MKEFKTQIESDLEEIVAEFNEILQNRGLDQLTVKNFRLDLKPQAKCKKWKWSCNSKTGVCYKVCLDNTNA